MGIILTYIFLFVVFFVVVWVLFTIIGKIQDFITHIFKNRKK